MKVTGIGAYEQLQKATAKSGAGGNKPQGFGEMLEKAVGKVNENILAAQDISERLAKGEPVDIADTMIAISKADVSFRLLMQVRNRALSAYEEIMRMQF